MPLITVPRDIHPMRILTEAGGIAFTNCYAIADETTRQCVLIDAPDHTIRALLDEIDASGFKLSQFWLTHGHFDHVADHSLVRSRYAHVKHAIHASDLSKLQKPGSSFFTLPFDILPGDAEVILSDNDTLALGNLICRVLHTPGHSPGHVMFHFEQQRVLVGGDLIIGGAIGRTDLPDSSLRDLAVSVRRVMQLPDETLLLPGHGAPSTLGWERQNNAYVRQILAGDRID